MKRVIIFIFTFIVLISLSFVKGNPIYSKRTDTIIDTTTDLEFHQAWLEFSEAILSGDLKLIKSLSSDCILCLDCVPKEDSAPKENEDPRQWYAKLYNQSRYINIDKFLAEDLQLIFNDKIKSRLLDKTKIKYNINDNHNSKLYDKPCIIGNLKTTQCEFKEVLLTHVDPTPGHKGGQLAFAFVKKGGKYKFSGFDTIP